MIAQALQSPAPTPGATPGAPSKVTPGAPSEVTPGGPPVTPGENASDDEMEVRLHSRVRELVFVRVCEIHVFGKSARTMQVSDDAERKEQKVTTC